VPHPTAGQRLLLWYDRAQRDLPWRRLRDPWAIWVSEVMLQQTRVETVIPYFERFLVRFPGPAALADATEEEVLAAWSGLGYYRRARQLQAGARAVVAAGGELPRRAKELEALPGVGPYTAAAIASIAFGEVVPVVDGNVERVITRRLALAGPPRSAANRERILTAARKLLDRHRPGDSNQALMELGATICLPRRPGCGECPLASGCRARAAGRAEEFPARPVRRSTERERQVAAQVLDAHGRMLLVRRPAGEAVLPGLWELPIVVAASPGEAERRLAERFGGTWRLSAPQVASVRHAITFRILEIVLHGASWSAGDVAEASELGWFDGAAAGRLALTGATRKLLAKS